MNYELKIVIGEKVYVVHHPVIPSKDDLISLNDPELGRCREGIVIQVRHRMAFTNGGPVAIIHLKERP